MLETLVQVAKEVLRYEADIKGVPSHLIEVNHLCRDPRKERKGEKEEVKVLFMDMESGMLNPEDYKDEERWKYLYTITTGRQAIGPSWIIDLKGKDKDKEAKKGVKEIKIGLGNLLKQVKNDSAKIWIKDCLRGLSGKEEMEILINKIQAKVSDIKALLVAQFGGEKPGEVEGIREAFIEQRILGEERARSSGEGMCGVCGKKGEIRSSILLPFFTIEKLGFAPMASEVEIWKYAPLCQECSKWLCIASDYLGSHLRTRVAGRWAYLIPNLELQFSEWPQKFIHYLWEFRARTSEKMVLEYEEFPMREEVGSLLEGIIEEWDWDSPPPFKSASLVFHEFQNQKVLFQYTTSDILPRQLKETSMRLKKLRDDLISGALEGIGKGTAGNLKSNFNFLNQAWQRTGKDQRSPLKLDPMRLVECLLTQSPPPPETFWSDADKILRQLYLDTIIGRSKVKQGFQQTVKDAISYRVALIWAIWSLLYKDVKGGTEVEITISYQSARLPLGFWEEFFEKKGMLDTNAKRGLYLVGVLFGRVEYQQRQERKDWKSEMPILGSLRGLTISVEELQKRLFPQVVMKLRQLSAYSRAASEVESAASYHLSCAEDTSDEEARFAFCLGWALTEHTLKSVWEALPSKEKEIEKEEE